MITEFAAALNSLKVATDISKLIKESSHTLEKAEVKLQIAELINALAEAKIAVAGVQDVMLEKDREIAQLKENLRIKDTKIFDKAYYWWVVDGEKTGPFCQKCYDTDQKQIRLQGNSDTDRWYCCTCKTTFLGKAYKAPQIVRQRSGRGWIDDY